MKRLCVFCGSRSGSLPAYAAAARELGRLMVQSGWGLVFGGGHVGLMGVVADGVLEHGGEVIGVIPQGLVDRELAHERCTTLHVTKSMHERKALMAELSDAFLALPGGFGTLDELFEILTWAQLGLHVKPVGLLDVAGFFSPLVSFLQRTVAEGFVRPGHLELLKIGPNAEQLLPLLEAPASAVREEKWARRGES